jgi:predicted nucleotidyltransferase
MREASLERSPGYFHKEIVLCHTAITVQPGTAMTVKEMGAATATRRPLPLQRMPMATTVNPDPVLLRYRKALGEIYGNRLERVVLYGSRARGDARPDSDYDVAVFLHDMNDLGPELHRLANLEVTIIDETGEVVHATPCRIVLVPMTSRRR